MDKTFSEGGRNSDFGHSWYNDIGNQLLIGMIVLSLQPIFNTFFELIVLKSLRYLRRFHFYRYHDNNQIDNIKFLELYAGPEHQFQRKTASLNAVLFITMCLGTAFPIFYTISLFAIIIQYIVERYTLAVFYRLPPKFSLDITEMNNLILAFGPLFGFGMSFWMLGNKQMFTGDKVEPLSRINGTEKSNHTIGVVISDIFKLHLSLAENMMLIGFACLVAYYFVLFLWSGFKSLRDTVTGKMKLDFQQSIAPEYFSSLREQDLEELVDEELIFS